MKRGLRTSCWWPAARGRADPPTEPRGLSSRGTHRAPYSFPYSHKTEFLSPLTRAIGSRAAQGDALQHTLGFQARESLPSPRHRIPSIVHTEQTAGWLLRKNWASISVYQKALWYTGSETSFPSLREARRYNWNALLQKSWSGKCLSSRSPNIPVPIWDPLITA